MKARYLAIAVLYATLLIAGCGFHLRGLEQAPLTARIQSVYIQGVDTETGLGRSLVQVLRTNGVVVLRTPESSASILEIKQSPLSKQVLSVDRQVRAREYALISRVQFRILEGKSVGPWQTVQSRRDLVVDPFQVLGSEQEEQRLKEEMQREIIQLMILRLRLTPRSE